MKKRIGALFPVREQRASRTRTLREWCAFVTLRDSGDQNRRLIVSRQSVWEPGRGPRNSALLFVGRRTNDEVCSSVTLWCSCSRPPTTGTSCSAYFVSFPF